jgi:hypothetical protein
MVLTLRLWDNWKLLTSQMGQSPFGRAPQQHVAAVCEWSGEQPGLGPPLLEPLGSTALMHLPTALAAESLGATAALSWQKMLMLSQASSPAGGGSGTGGNKAVDERVRQVCSFTLPAAV